MGRRNAERGWRKWKATEREAEAGAARGRAGSEFRVPGSGLVGRKTEGARERAVSYIQIKTERGRTLFGAGVDTNIELASIKAIVSALNRALAKH